MVFCLPIFVYARLFSDDDEDKVVWNVECHYTQADIEGRIINLGDCVYVKVNAPIFYENLLKMDISFLMCNITISSSYQVKSSLFWCYSYFCYPMIRLYFWGHKSHTLGRSCYSMHVMYELLVNNMVSHNMNSKFHYIIAVILLHCLFQLVNLI